MGRVFSGVQPTGNLHLGNYLGAIKNFVSLQNDHECIYCVVDMHAITVKQDPKTLKNNILEVAAAFVASGINPEKSVIFVQSQVSAHAELAWIFNCVARLGWLNRMTQFKEKAGKNRENASAGLYTYPVLMAADILAYHATHVPVGDDQRQHLELARDIAQKFNNDFQVEYFPITEPVIMGNATRVMSLRDGKSKMSKSDISDYSRLNLTDSADDISNKIKNFTLSQHSDHVVVKTTEIPKKFIKIINKEFRDVSLVGYGRSIEIFKQVGNPKDVVKKFDLDSFSGTHGIGHTRMATESAITTDGSHPYSTGEDECLVHNGSLSNHNNLRRELKKKGNTFNSENDTEVAAGYVSNSLSNNNSLKDTLMSGLKDLDGFYTFITGTRNGFAVVRDEIACKPAVIAETNNYVAIASEFQAMAHLPDVNNAKIFEPEPGVVYSWGN